MTESPARLDLKELGAYIDGELEGQRRGQVASQLAGCPADAALGCRLRPPRSAVTPRACDAAGQELPRSLQRLILGRRLRWQRQRAAIAAAILFLFIATAGAAWLTNTAPPPADLAELARDAAAVYRVDAPAPSVPQIFGEMSKRSAVCAALRSNRGEDQVPDLQRYGFGLVAEELLTTEQGSAAHLTYVDIAGRRLTCFFRRRLSSSDERLRVIEDDGLVTSYGADDTLGYAMTARLGRQELQAIAEATYEGTSL